MFNYDLILMTLHLIVAFAFARLCRKAPCRMQKLIAGGLSVGMLSVGAAFAFRFSGIEGYFDIFIIGLLVGHLSNLLYAFRLFTKEHLCLPEHLISLGSTPSRNS